jgi:hypothetical protein
MGNGTRASLGKRRRIDRSIAHNELAARAKLGPSLRGAAFSPEIEARALANLPLPEKQISGRARHQERPAALSRIQIIRL